MSLWSLLTQCIVLTGLGFLLLLFLILLLPPNTRKLISHPRPVAGYDEALRRIEAINAWHSTDLNPDCHDQLLTHDRKVDHAIIFAHGYSNCPKQFRVLGEAFYALGYNVLIAPMPYHGLKDRMTTEQSRLTAVQLAEYADTVVDIAHGLGEHVVLAGLSGGGVVTAWAAQHRSDPDLAVLLSPAFGFTLIPTPLTDPATRLFLRLPNFFKWWDPRLKETIGPEHAYPRVATRALAQLLLLAYSVRIAASREQPAARAILVVTNANDTSVNNALTAQVVEHWRASGARDLRTFEFDANLKLGHDFIDPSQPDQQIDIVYPKLIELISAQIEALGEA